MHLIGLELKKEFPDLKWIADFRDPWTEISYYKHLKLTKTADQKHRNLEQQVFENADITLATSFSDAENFREKGANAICITNGFDGNEIDGKSDKKNSKFTLSYIGVLEQLRNPGVLWKVLNEIVLENVDFRNDFKLKFVGKIDDKILREIEHSDLKDSVNNLGYLSHSESNREMRNSDLLLIANFPDERSKGIIPGKIFEYLVTGKQILSFGPKESDVKKILEETNAGRHFSYDDQSELKVFLLQKFEEWKSGISYSQTQNIGQFSRKNLTQKLSKLL